MYLKSIVPLKHPFGDEMMFVFNVLGFGMEVKGLSSTKGWAQSLQLCNTHFIFGLNAFTDVPEPFRIKHTSSGFNQSKVFALRKSILRRNLSGELEVYAFIKTIWLKNLDKYSPPKSEHRFDTLKFQSFVQVVMATILCENSFSTKMTNGLKQSVMAFLI